jgi:hypothetical protein
MKKAICGVFVLLPFAVLALMVNRYAVDVPDWDQWDLVPFLEKSFEGTLTGPDLWTQHNEHRIFFPRVIMISLARLSRWNIGYELAASLALAVGIFLLLAASMKTTFRSHLASVPLWPFVILSLMVFSLNGVENWLWGWNIQIVLNVLSGIGMILLLTSRRPGWRKIIAAGMLGLIGLYSYASGLVYFPLGLLLLFLGTPIPLRQKVRFSLFWVPFSAAAYFSYFYKYVLPSHHPSWTIILKSPLAFLRYVLTYLGAPLLSSDTNPRIAFFAGLAGAIILAVVWTMVLISRKSGLRHLSPYLAFSLYAIGTAVLTGLGRAGFGDRQAMSPRYVAFSSLLWISLLVLIIILLGEVKESPPARPARFLLVIILALFTGIAAMSSYHSRVLFKERYERLKPAREELFSLQNEVLLERIYPHLQAIDQARMERDVNILKARKLSVFREK